ncbi:hypothetical protein LguiB_035845 [Lonicera macranthoides]
MILCIGIALTGVCWRLEFLEKQDAEEAKKVEPEPEDVLANLLRIINESKESLLDIEEDDTEPFLTIKGDPDSDPKAVNSMLKNCCMHIDLTPTNTIKALYACLESSVMLYHQLMKLNISNLMSMSSAPKSISSSSKLITSNLTINLDPDPCVLPVVNIDTVNKLEGPVPHLKDHSKMKMKSQRLAPLILAGATGAGGKTIEEKDCVEPPVSIDEIAIDQLIPFEEVDCVNEIAANQSMLSGEVDPLLDDVRNLKHQALDLSNEPINYEEAFF